MSGLSPQEVTAGRLFHALIGTFLCLACLSYIFPAAVYSHAVADFTLRTQRAMCRQRGDALSILANAGKTEGGGIGDSASERLAVD